MHAGAYTAASKEAPPHCTLEIMTAVPLLSDSASKRTRPSASSTSSSSSVHSTRAQRRSGPPSTESAAAALVCGKHYQEICPPDADNVSRSAATEQQPLSCVNTGGSSFSKRAGVICLLLLTSIIGLLAATSYFNNQPDAPGCAMTYSRPQFVEQTEFSRSWTRYSIKYKLYLYREGGYDAFDEPSRIPVLFVPGNAGSHKQVRSIASSAAAAFVEMIGKDPSAVDHGQIGYDFFTVGLNEEFTALHGYSILEQADFINDAIRYILSLYPKTRTKHKLSHSNAAFALPASVIVVGHSMGGVVARTAFTLPNYVEDSIRAIFTMSTPHNNPTASLEQYVESAYSRVNEFWRHGFNNGTLKDVSLVSISGGNLDSMINSDYTYVGDLAPPSNSLSVMSSGINDVWLSLDHQSILWCAQMAKKFARMMIQVMDARQPSQLLPLDKRMSIMRRELYSGIEPGALPTRKETPSDKNIISSNYQYTHIHDGDTIRLSPADMRILPLGRTKATTKTKSLHLLPINGSASTDKNELIFQLLYDPRLFASFDDAQELSNLQILILGCNRESDTSAKGGSLDIHMDSSNTEDKRDESFVCERISAPTTAKLPLKRARHNPNVPVQSLRYSEIPLQEFKQYSHIGLELPSRPGKSGFLEAAFVKTPTQLDKTPGYFQLMMPYAIRIWAGNEAFGMRSRIRIDIPENPLFVLRAKLTMRRNEAAARALSTASRFAPIVFQSDGRLFESKFWYDQNTFDLAIHGRGSYLPSDGNTDFFGKDGHLVGMWDGLYIDVFADTEYYAGFDIVLQVNWYSSLNRMVKRYDMALLALSFVWACLVLAHQLRTWNGELKLVLEYSRLADTNAPKPKFPDCLATVEQLIRNGTLALMLAAAALTPVIQDLVAHTMKNSWSPATLASWKNLFMGVRGVGWTLCIAPMLLVVASLGFVALEAIVLTLVCNLTSRVFARIFKLSGKAKAIAETAEADTIASVKNDGSQGAKDIAANFPMRPLIATVAFVVFVCTFVPYQFAFLVIYMAQLITTVRTMVCTHIVSQKPTKSGKRSAAVAILQDRSSYQLALLLFWTSSLPYCAAELLVWVRNISVFWFEDAPSDHNLANMAGFFALRILATYHIVPRLGRSSELRSSPQSWAIKGLRVATYGILVLSIVYAWLFSIRRPYTLYNIGNIISAWLAIVQFADYIPDLIDTAYRSYFSPQGSRALSPATTPRSSPLIDQDTQASRNTHNTSRSGDKLDRKLR